MKLNHLFIAVPLAVMPALTAYAQYYDVETGLHQNGYRDYDPNLGRYLESDPIGLVAGPSTYGYAFQNPLYFVDPTGLDGTAAWWWAVMKTGNEDYQFVDENPFVRGTLRELVGGRFSPKCNFFVYDALLGGGDPPLLMPDGRRPSAGEWANPNVDIPGYHVVSRPMLGDVVAYDGHVGIYSPLPNGRPGTISASTETQSVIQNDWGFRSEQRPTFRRCDCEE